MHRYPSRFLFFCWSDLILHQKNQRIGRLIVLGFELSKLNQLRRKKKDLNLKRLTGRA